MDWIKSIVVGCLCGYVMLCGDYLVDLISIKVLEMMMWDNDYLISMHYWMDIIWCCLVHALAEKMVYLRVRRKNDELFWVLICLGTELHVTLHFEPEYWWIGCMCLNSKWIPNSPLVGSISNTQWTFFSFPFLPLSSAWSPPCLSSDCIVCVNWVYLAFLHLVFALQRSFINFKQFYVMSMLTSQVVYFFCRWNIFQFPHGRNHTRLWVNSSTYGRKLLRKDHYQVILCTLNQFFQSLDSLINILHSTQLYSMLALWLKW